MATVLVDTDVFSFLTSTNPKRGASYKPHVQGHTIALAFITVGEQYAGYLKKVARGEWPLSRLRVLESNLRKVVIVPYDVEVCKQFGEIKANLKNPDGSDRIIASNDLWIAACAKTHSLPLVTNNRKHLCGIQGLNVISEPPC